MKVPFGRGQHVVVHCTPWSSMPHLVRRQPTRHFTPGHAMTGGQRQGTRGPAKPVAQRGRVQVPPIPGRDAGRVQRVRMHPLDGCNGSKAQFRCNAPGGCWQEISIVPQRMGQSPPAHRHRQRAAAASATTGNAHRFLTCSSACRARCGVGCARHQASRPRSLTAFSQLSSGSCSSVVCSQCARARIC